MLSFTDLLMQTYRLFGTATDLTVINLGLPDLALVGTGSSFGEVELGFVDGNRSPLAREARLRSAQAPACAFPVGPRYARPVSKAEKAGATAPALRRAASGVLGLDGCSNLSPHSLQLSKTFLLVGAVGGRSITSPRRDPEEPSFSAGRRVR